MHDWLYSLTNGISDEILEKICIIFLLQKKKENPKFSTVIFPVFRWTYNGDTRPPLQRSVL